jgi:hypothetical protein
MRRNVPTAPFELRVTLPPQTATPGAEPLAAD